MELAELLFKGGGFILVALVRLVFRFPRFFITLAIVWFVAASI